MSAAINIVRKFFPNVKSVEDATNIINVEVTNHDSQKSSRKDHNHCALAVACKRKEHADGVIISLKTAYIIKGKTATRYKLRESASREVVSFDRHHEFAPGEYQLNPPAESERLGANPHRSGVATGAKPGSRKPRHFTKGVRTTLKEVK